MAKKEQNVNIPFALKEKESRMASERFYISKLGEPYTDMLIVEAWLKGRTLANEGNQLLCAKLMQRKEYRDQLVAELARKRGIPFEQMWDDILTGKAESMSTDEYTNLRASTLEVESGDDE